MCWFVVALLW